MISDDSKKKQPRAQVYINLRIPAFLLKKIDSIVESHDLGISRTTWIIETLDSKIKELENA